MPGRLRIADIDHNGFVDIILTLVNSDSSTSTYLYENYASDNSTLADNARQLVRSSAIDGVLEYAGSNSKLITFLDIDEDGRLDYLIQD